MRAVVARAGVCFASVTACAAILVACENLSGLNSTDTTSPDAKARDGATGPDGIALTDDGSSTTDTTPTGPACDLTSPFESPVLVGGLTNATPRGARLLPDEKTAFTFVVVSNSLMIGSATRASVADAFGLATPLDTLGSGDSTNDPAPTVSAAGTLIVFSRISNNLDRLFAASRPDISQPFGEPKLLPVSINEANAVVEFPYLRPDGNVLYFSRYVPGPGPPTDRAIFRSEKSGPNFLMPTPVTEINSTSAEFSPVVTGDELTIFWASPRPDLFAKGGTDILMATRTTIQQPFTNIRNVSELNTSDTDDPQWVSPDGCRLYFTSLSGGATNVLMAKHAKK